MSTATWLWYLKRFLPKFLGGFDDFDNFKLINITRNL